MVQGSPGCAVASLVLPQPPRVRCSGLGSEVLAQAAQRPQVLVREGTPEGRAPVVTYHLLTTPHHRRRTEDLRVADFLVL